MMGDAPVSLDILFEKYLYPEYDQIEDIEHGITEEIFRDLVKPAQPIEWIETDLSKVEKLRSAEELKDEFFRT